MFTWFLLVLFVFAGTLSYFLGMRNDKPWGKSGLVVSLLLIAGLLFYRNVLAGKILGPPRKAPVSEKQSTGAAKLMGKALSTHLNPRNHILIVHFNEIGSPLPVVPEQWKQGLTEGLGFHPQRVTTTALGGPPGTLIPDILAEKLREERDIDAVVSFAGWPQKRLYPPDSRPMVVAMMPNSSPATIRHLLQNGQLEAAVGRSEDGGLQLFTPDKLPPE